MRRHRKLLIGLGIGLMLGSAMLELMQVARSAPTEEKLLSDADKLGYRVVKADERIYTQAEVDDLVAGAIARAEQEAAADGAAQSPEPTPESTPTPTPTPEPTPTPTPTPKPKPSATTKPPKATPARSDRVTLDIQPGASLIRVADDLLELGVLKSKADRDAFVKEALPYKKTIMPGKSVFVGDVTYEQIIAEITRRKE